MNHQLRRTILAKLEPRMRAQVPVAFYDLDEIEVAIRRRNEATERKAIERWTSKKQPTKTV